MEICWKKMFLILIHNYVSRLNLHSKIWYSTKLDILSLAYISKCHDFIRSLAASPQNVDDDTIIVLIISAAQFALHSVINETD